MEHSFHRGQSGLGSGGHVGGGGGVGNVGVGSGIVGGSAMAFGGSFPTGMPPLHHNNNAYLHHQRAW